MLLDNVSQLQASTDGIGNAGSISLNISEEIAIDSGSGIFSDVGETGQENGGNVEVFTNTFSLTNFSGINTNTFGIGNAGNIIIDANNISLDEVSQVFSNVEITGEGNAGSINITANFLSVTNGTQIGSSTRGNGNGGIVNINADTITFDGTGIGFDNGELVTLFSTVFSSVEQSANGDGGTINITADSLSVTNEAQLAAGTRGNGNAGNIFVNANTVLFDSGSLFNNVEAEDAEGNGGIVEFNANNISILNGSQFVGSTFGIGNAGNFTINAEDSVLLDGVVVSEEGEFRSAILSTVQENAIGNGSTIEIDTNNLSIINGARLDVTTRGKGDAGNIIVNAENILLDGVVTIGEEIFRSGIFSEVSIIGKGNGGDIAIDTGNFSVNNGSRVTTISLGEGSSGNININSNFISLENNTEINSFSISSENAGDIFLKVLNTLEADDSDIDASSFQSAGGQLDITAENIFLRGDSDIRTNVFSGADNGGNIILTADSIIAFDDSDIFAFSQDGRGGNITLDTPAYFAENFTLNSLNTNPDDLENNDRADINATGVVSGAVTIPDVSFIQNSLTELPDNAINTDELVANSCVAPVGNRQQGRFIITGGDNLPVRPGNANISEFATGEVRGVPQSNRNSWQRGDAIVEPEGVYRLTDGKLILSRECF